MRSLKNTALVYGAAKDENQKGFLSGPGSRTLPIYFWLLPYFFFIHSLIPSFHLLEE